MKSFLTISNRNKNSIFSNSIHFSTQKIHQKGQETKFALLCSVLSLTNNIVCWYQRPHVQLRLCNSTGLYGEKNKKPALQCLSWLCIALHKSFYYIDIMPFSEWRNNKYCKHHGFNYNIGFIFIFSPPLLTLTSKSRNQGGWNDIQNPQKMEAFRESTVRFDILYLSGPTGAE